MKNYNKKNDLKKLVRENLMKQKEIKSNLLTEGKIIKDRFLVLLENRSINTKTKKEKLYRDILIESNNLYERGFNNKLITEGFFDIITGIFGKSGSGIIQNIKEYFAEYIVKKFGIDPSGWMGSLITTTIGNLDLSDIPKLLNCNFTTKLLSKSLAETAIKKIQSAAGLEGTLSNILRNSLVESLEENSTLMVKLEEAVGSFICPLISKISGNLEKQSDNIKSKAFASEPPMFD